MNLINWFYNNNSKKYIIICSIISVLGLTLIYSRYFGLVSLSDSMLLDMSFFYNQTEFFDVLRSLSIDEILAYKLVHIADYVFAIGFYPLLSLVITKAFNKDNKLHWFVLLPLFTGVFDILENLMMDIHLYSQPSEFLFLGNVAGIFTVLKFSILQFIILLLIVQFIVKFVRRNKS